MKREELKALGLTDEQIEKVMSINGQDINGHKTALDAEKAKAQETAAQLARLQADLAAAQRSAGDATALKAQLQAAQDALNATQKAAKLRSALGKYNPKDADLLLKLIDQSKVSIAESGEITGLDGQIEPLKKSSGYLFADAPTPSGGAPLSEPGGSGFDMNAFLRGEK